MTRWRDWLGLNSSTVAFLGAFLLITAGTELWSPLAPEDLPALRTRALGGSALTVFLVGLYGFYRDGLETVDYYAGGAIGGRFNTRRSLPLFNLLPLVGLVGAAAFSPVSAGESTFDHVCRTTPASPLGDQFDPNSWRPKFNVRLLFRRSPLFRSPPAFVLNRPILARR